MWNMIFQDDPIFRRRVPVPAGTKAGMPLHVSGKPAVAVTDRGDVEKTRTRPDGATVKREMAYVGSKSDEAVVTFTGTFALDVTGASKSTQPGTIVYITNSNQLSTTASGNKHFGVVEFFRGETSTTDTAVRIGVNG